MKPWTRAAITAVALIAAASALAFLWTLTTTPPLPHLPAPGTSPSAATGSGAAEEGRVVAVVDGDTLDVRLSTGTGTVRVRVLGIDTPEIGRRGKTDDCFAQEARTFLDERAFGRTVRLDADPSQADKDKYGRLIRYVALPDGADPARAALAAGMGTEYTYDRPYTRQADYRAAETTARAAGAGLWGACTRGTGR